jgi:hypothetical protein
LSKQNLLSSEGKRTPVIRTRLADKDAARFAQECGISKKTIAELAREAICFYLDHKDQSKNLEKDSFLEQRMKKMENRMAGLQARIAIDVGMIYHLLYRNMDPAKRDADIAWAYNGAVARLKKKLEGQASEVKESIKDSYDKHSS